MRRRTWKDRLNPEQQLSVVPSRDSSFFWGLLFLLETHAVYVPSTTTDPSPPHLSPNMPLVGAVQVADALVPRVLTLSSDMLLSDAMRAFRLTRNEFAIVVGPSGFDTAREASDAREVEGSSETRDGEDVAAGGTNLSLIHI